MGWRLPSQLASSLRFAQNQTSRENRASTPQAQRDVEVENPHDRPARRTFAFPGSHFRLSCWVVMLYSGFATIVAGTSAEKYGGGWQIALVA
jgi:hypothetical protein